MKMLIDAAASGVFMGMSIEAARALLEEMASNDYHWSDERAIQKKSSGVYGVDAIDLLMSKFDALAQRFNRMNTPSSRASSSMGWDRM